MVKLTQLGATILTVALVGCSAETDTDPKAQEAFSMQQQITQRQALNDQRSEVVQAMDDQALARFLWQQEQQNYYWALETLAFDSAPYEIEYTQSSLARLADYDTPEAMQEAYLGSLLALSRSDYRTCRRHSEGQGLRVQPGFSLPLPHTLTVEQLVMNDGSSLALTDISTNRGQASDIIQAGDNYCYSMSHTPKDLQPDAVTGQLEVMLPDALVEFELTAEDVGAAKQKDGYVVTLLELNNYSYTIEVRTQGAAAGGVSEQAIVAEALAADGRYIKPRVTDKQLPGQTTKTGELLAELFKNAQRGNLDLISAQQEVIKLQQQFEQQQASVVYSAHAFHGPVETARITLLAGADTTQVEHFRLPVYSLTVPGGMPADEPFNTDSLPAIDLTKAVYERRDEVIAEHQELDKQTMDELIEIRQRNIPLSSDPSIEFPAQVFFHYPHVQSNLFIPVFERYQSPAPDQVIFYNARGEEVTLQPGTTDDKSTTQDRAFTFMVSRLEYDPDAFTERPQRLRAIVPVNTAPEMIKDRYSKNQLPPGITLTGNRLVIDYAQFEPREINDISSRMVERRNQVFARDSHGYLAEIDTLTITRQGGEPVDVYYFYGTPETFEIWYKGETHEVDWEIEIDLQG